MIIVKLFGGLGNQMFQYAFARYLSLKHNTDLKVDTSILKKRTNSRRSFVFRDFDLDIFNLKVETASVYEVNNFRRVPLAIADKMLNRLIGFKKGYIVEPHFHFSEKCYAATDNSYLDGYWQSEKYFGAISENLRINDFSFKQPIANNSRLLISQIENCNSVCLNVRRGDFVTNSFHGTCSNQYFKKAEEIMATQIDNPHFFVFSDEIDWCKDNLRLNSPTTYIGHEYAGNKFQDYIRLMAACKHFIIPNSSFAWWAVWLNTNKQKIVIAPKDWFSDKTINTKDLIQPGWIIL